MEEELYFYRRLNFKERYYRRILLKTIVCFSKSMIQDNDVHFYKNTDKKYFKDLRMPDTLNLDVFKKDRSKSGAYNPEFVWIKCTFYGYYFILEIFNTPFYMSDVSDFVKDTLKNEETSGRKYVVNIKDIPNLKKELTNDNLKRFCDSKKFGI